MTDQASNPLLTRLLMALGSPAHVPDASAYLAECHRLTGAFSAAVLDKAADLVLRRTTKWPAPKVMIDACVDAEEALGARSTARVKTEDYPWEIAQQKAGEWAAEMMRLNPLAQEAEAYGWSVELRKAGKAFAWAQLRGKRDLPPPAQWRPTDGEIQFLSARGMGAARGKVPTVAEVTKPDDGWRSRAQTNQDRSRLVAADKLLPLPVNKDRGALVRALKGGVHG